jgi:hypothetical protein
VAQGQEDRTHEVAAVAVVVVLPAAAAIDADAVVVVPSATKMANVKLITKMSIRCGII